MKLLDRLERRFGGYAVPGLTLWLLAGQALVFAGAYLGPLANEPQGGVLATTERLALDPGAVLQGEWWRLVTFLFIAPLGHFPLLVAFYFYFFYLIGTTLEGVWGAFRYTAFLTIGYVATVAAAFVAHAIAPGSGWTVGDFLYGSMFLAFARLFPDFQILLMFVLPVKVRWLAWVQWALYAMVILTGGWHDRMMATAAVANVLLFFGADMLRDARHGHQRMRRKATALKQPAKATHVCRVCGLTSDEAPRTAFRYCSKCSGGQCYCPDHLGDHEHVTEGEVRE